ncbi:hypothetical protein BS47DRAFT_1361298 [Hydnum rufescens UP504]|uniref:Uncharacterized protein n=1 Tax=Hydnum rufescens UP504 TaxID=1448309 RepID=A0A9P6AZU1_9AGAM|nr:hypothetical protein BS47DRAFT_1361298 [Hydnum rufescens UP504]
MGLDLWRDLSLVCEGWDFDVGGEVGEDQFRWCRCMLMIIVDYLNRRGIYGRASGRWSMWNVRGLCWDCLMVETGGPSPPSGCSHRSQSRFIPRPGRSFVPRSLLPSPLKNHQLWIACSPYHADMAHSTFGKPGSSILYNRVSRRFQGFWLMSRRNLWNFPQPGVPPVFWGGVGFEFDVGKRQFTFFSVATVARHSTPEIVPSRASTSNTRLCFLDKFISISKYESEVF